MHRHFKKIAIFTKFQRSFIKKCINLLQNLMSTLRAYSAFVLREHKNKV